MNRLKWGLTVVAIVVIAGIFFRLKNTSDEFTGKEFLFDTYCTVTVYGKNAEEAVSAVFERVSEIHNATNIFSADSEVSAINSAKKGEKVPVGEDVARILSVAQKVQKASDGAFDVSIAPIVLLWNFGGEGHVPSNEELEKALTVSGGEMVVFDSDARTVVKGDDAARIDLGGVAKGYAGDEAISVLKRFEVEGAIVDFGGNILCMGKNPNTETGLWRIGLQTPFAPTGEYNEEKILEIAEGAVVTSGNYQRYFEKNGTKYHHIIDPSTGYPVESDYNSVSVVADSGLVGDCLSTACFVLGREKGEVLAEEFGAEIYFD